MNKAFTFDAPAFEITKSYRDTNGQMFVEGIASTTDIDLTGERMSPEVIAKMAARLVGKPLRDEHQKGWYDKMGEIIQADVVDNLGQPALWIKAKLFDWNTKSRDLFNMLKGEGVKMGLSVAGKINKGGLVKELVESMGKYIPTYRDVEPTEVSITDHPANLGTWAAAVAKSLNLDQYDPDEFVGKMQKAGEDGVKNASDEKPSEYVDVKTTDFLDPEHYKYPADEKHIMPALRYFNHDGQREAGGYDDAAWAAMGKKLAAKLNKITSDTYSYDPSTEKIIKGEGTSTTTEKEVNTPMDKGNLVSKKIPDAVLALGKEWGRDIAAEMKTDATEMQKNEDKPTEGEVKKGSSDSSSSSSGGSFSVPTLGGSDSSSDSSSSGSDSSSSGSDSSDTSTTSSDSSMESLMSDLESTLKQIQDSLSSTASTTDTSSGSGSSSGSDSSKGSSSSSSGSDKTSTDKAMSDSSMDKYAAVGGDNANGASSDEDSDAAIGKAIDSLKMAQAALEKAKSKNKPNLKDQSSESASDYSSSDNVNGKVEAKKAMPNTKEGANGTQHSRVVASSGKPALADQASEEASDRKASPNAKKMADMGKALLEALTIIKEMQKSSMKKSEEETARFTRDEEGTSRKGYAITLEKKFTGHQDVGVQANDEDLYQKIINDKEIGFREQLLYKEYGQLPKKYAGAKQ